MIATLKSLLGNVNIYVISVLVSADYISSFKLRLDFPAFSSLWLFVYEVRCFVLFFNCILDILNIMLLDSILFESSVLVGYL